MIDSNIPQFLKNVCLQNCIQTNTIDVIVGATINDPFFLRNDLIIQQKILCSTPSFTICWLTISRCVITFNNIHFKCKIQVTAQSTIYATNCIFAPYDEQCECSVEIFANSNAYFTNCKFINANKTSVAIRDRSEASFDNCHFKDSLNTSILILDKSRANINQCIFTSANRFSIYLFRNSISKITNSRFFSQKGKAIFLLTGCQAHIFNCQFEQCNGGGISIADSSETFVYNCLFNNIGCSSIHGIKNSIVNVEKCKMKNCKGNGINFEFSTGYAYKCQFKNFDFPVIACYGINSAPVIFKSKIKNCNAIAIASRDCSSPFFSKLVISNTKKDVFSISDFANAVIDNCVIKKIKENAFSIFNGATVSIQNNIIQYDEILYDKIVLFKSFTQGKINYRNNTVISKSDSLSINVHNFGIVNIDEFIDNAFYQVNDNDELKEKNIYIPEVYPISITTKNDIKINIEPYNYNKNVILHYCENDEENNNQINDLQRIGLINDDDNNPPKEKKDKKDSNSLLTSIFQGKKRLEQISAPSDMPPPLPFIEIDDIMNRIVQEYLNDNENDNICNHHHHHNHSNVCMKCGLNPADHIAYPCGHKVLCKKCAVECSPQKQQETATPVPQFIHNCPLCQIPIYGCTEEYDEPLCSICLENNCDTIFLPCGHRCVCYKCATQIWSDKKQCPLCQKRILSFHHMFKIDSNE